MSKGDRHPVLHEPQALNAGATLDFYALDARLTYVPYFYNPSLTPDGRTFLVASDATGSEQAYAVDRESREAVQLTDAAGHGQDWAPYIRTPVDGVRPQFVCWSRPDWASVLFWEGNELRRVHIGTLAEEALFSLPQDIVPSPPHCSECGIACFGYLPRKLQDTMLTRSVEEIEADLERGWGFIVLDAASHEVIANVATPFWPNHVAASRDGRRVLLCHEGSWRRQRMYIYDLLDGHIRPLRPQDDGAAIGHEFWIGANRVGYHGHVEGRSVFGIVDVATGDRRETPAVHAERHAAHYHASPNAQWIVTDGEITRDYISVARTGDAEIRFEPVCRHGWPRDLDQRYHPHPHWHRIVTPDGASDVITFTATDVGDDGMRTGVGVLSLPVAAAT